MLKGFGQLDGQNIDWGQFTLENRILDSEIPYKNIAEDWQKEIDNAIPSHQCVYLQLARGHDKTDRFAWWSLCWLSTTHAARGYAAGVDRDNAALFRDSSRKLKALHPDLFYAIEVQKNIVLNKETGSYIETISSDADSAYGLNFDLLIINDFHAWPDLTFWDILWTACGKKPGIRIWIESNALTLGAPETQGILKFRNWIEKRSTGKNPVKGLNGNTEWFYYNPRAFLATWQNDKLKQWQETMHPSAYRRLIENIDTSGEESFVTPEQVEQITTLAGVTKENKGNGYTITAIDIGLKKDATAIATVRSVPTTREKGKIATPKMVLLALDTIVGSPDDPVQIKQIEQLMYHHVNSYGSQRILMDPWNAQSIIQKWSKAEEWVFTAAHVRELTQCLYRSIADRHLTIYPDAGRAMQDGEEWTLQRELINAVLKDCSYGQRVDHKANGYSDRLMAVGMCVHNLMSEGKIPFAKLTKDKAEKDEWNGGKMIDEWSKESNNKLLSLGRG